MANNFLKLLQTVVERGGLQGITNIKDLYGLFAESGISYKDFKKLMHDYGIYGHLGKHDAARLSGMYYGSKQGDLEAKKPQTIARVELKTLSTPVNASMPFNIPLIKILKLVKSSKTPSNSTKETKSNLGPIYASESTARWRDYSTGTDLNPKLIAGNGNGPGSGYSRLDNRGIGPDNTPIVVYPLGQAYVVGPNGQAFNGQFDAETLDRLGLIQNTIPSVSKSIADLNLSLYGEGYDQLTYRQLVDFSNYRKMHPNATVSDYLKSILPLPTANYLNPVNIVKTVIESRNNPQNRHPLYTRVGTTFKLGGTLNKFQQGGQAQLSSLNDAVMLFVQAIALTLQTDPQQIIAAAQANPEALKSAVQVYQLTLDIQQAALTFAQAINAKTQAAKHGAKLDYLKSLKHLCAEDEELVYFKKGGSVGCGCKKKAQGGEMKDEKKDSPVKRFKMARGGQTPEKKSNKKSNKLDQASIDSTLVNKYDDLEILASRPGYYIPNPNKGKNGDERELIWVPDRSKAPYKKEVKTEACGGKMKKESCGGAVAKFKADKCGGKMKKHLLGGSLNGIPFIKKVQLKTV